LELGVVGGTWFGLFGQMLSKMLIPSSWLPFTVFWLMKLLAAPGPSIRMPMS
jgi:hypothetical protein